MELSFCYVAFHSSPVIEKIILEEEIANAIMRTEQENVDVVKTLKLHIGIGLGEKDGRDIQIRITEIDAELKAMTNAISANTVETFDRVRALELRKEKNNLLQQLEQFADIQQKRKNAASWLEKLYTILEGLKNHRLLMMTNSFVNF